jgi:hypothetical protein
MHEIMLAEIRRQDMLAEFARYRPGRQAQPTQPLEAECKALVWGAVQAVCGSARGALDALSCQILRVSGRKKGQFMLTVAR